MVRALALWPAASLSALALESVTFRVVRGRWPLPNQDDPKLQGFLMLHPLTQVLIVSVPAVFVLMVFLVGRQWRLFLSERAYRLAVGVFALGLASLALIPDQIWEWFWD